MFVAIVVGVLVGLLAGRFRDTPLDVGGRLFGIVIYAMPVFFIGLMAQLLFGSYLGWLPTSGRASPITQATLETHTNIFTIDAIYDRNWERAQGRRPAPDPAGRDARARHRGRLHPPDPRERDPDAEGRLHRGGARAGDPERDVVYHHAFKNALVPVVTVIGLQLALLLCGAVLTETTFNWPGIGHTLSLYLENRDYAAVQGIIVVFALVVVVVSAGDRLHERVHRPEDPVLMAVDATLRLRSSVCGAAQEARGVGLGRWMLCIGVAITVVLRAACDLRAADLAVRLRPVPVDGNALPAARAPSARPPLRDDRAVDGRPLAGRLGRADRAEVVLISLVSSLCRRRAAGPGIRLLRRRLDRILVLIIDALFAFPSLLLAICDRDCLRDEQQVGGILTAAISITVVVRAAVLPRRAQRVPWPRASSRTSRQPVPWARRRTS